MNPPPNIVTDLRERTQKGVRVRDGIDKLLMARAADEIEHLRAEVERLKQGEIELVPSL